MYGSVVTVELRAAWRDSGAKYQPPLAPLQVQIERARETLAAIEETSWGVTLREIDGERFVVLPGGALEDPPWTVRGRPAVKLSSE